MNRHGLLWSFLGIACALLVAYLAAVPCETRLTSINRRDGVMQRKQVWFGVWTTEQVVYQPRLDRFGTLTARAAWLPCYLEVRRFPWSTLGWDEDGAPYREGITIARLRDVSILMRTSEITDSYDPAFLFQVRMERLAIWNRVEGADQALEAITDIELQNVQYFGP
jgi:hypothetical protein